MDHLTQINLAENFATELSYFARGISGPEMEDYILQLHLELEDLRIADEYYRELAKYSRQ